uniref:Uncharacterized protein n=1 Tax=Photinus pyralis TaxID=7054 RepID=A0A1Y1LY01_PHOPY
MTNVKEDTRQVSARVGIPTQLDHTQQTEHQGLAILRAEAQVHQAVEVPAVKLVMQRSRARYADQIRNEKRQEKQLRISIEVNRSLNLRVLALVEVAPDRVQFGVTFEVFSRKRQKLKQQVKVEPQQDDVEVAVLEGLPCQKSIINRPLVLKDATNIETSA